jgi:tRNA threonylcarbamoyladenosine biosynthesis protein TsaE
MTLSSSQSNEMHGGRIEVITHSPEDTQNVGRTLGSHAEPGHVYLLFGELGSGKTCLTQGVLWGLGGDEYARSPTFVLITEYAGRLPLYHVDLYRIGSTADVADIGLDEYLFGDGVCAIEWSDRASEFLDGVGHLEVRFERLGENDRRLAISARDHRYDAVMDAVESTMTAARWV